MEIWMTEPRAKKVILLVDDEPLLLLDAGDLLVEAGYEVITASSADHAIKLLSEGANVSLVVTDINMPGSMSGLGLIKVIRDRWPPVKLIIVSSHSVFKQGDVPADVPIFGKPFRFKELHAKARELMGLG
jgi:DNA-binding NtrC family response regulator